MSSTISIVAHAIWACLPEATVELRFATALIGFCLTATLMIRRLRCSMRSPRVKSPHEPRRRGPDQPVQASVTIRIVHGASRSKVGMLPPPDANQVR